MQKINDPFETKVEIISIEKDVSITFMYAPAGYVINKVTFENHETKILGRLNQFNRLKILQNWREENGDLVSIFRKLLEKKGWDFNLFPNPIAYVALYKNN